MMSNPPQEQGPTAGIVSEFRTLLQSEWTRPVACQNQCHPPESCKCQRFVVHVDALKAWWTRRHSGSTNQTKLHRLLDEMTPAQHRKFPLEYQNYFTGEQSCLRVFSLLLRQNRGHLIDKFHDSNIDDRYLEFGHKDMDQGLRDNLANATHPSEIDLIIQEFHQEKWGFCPLQLTLHVDRNLQTTKVIPPFCHKIKLADKGGTASIYWVAIQKDLISDDRLKSALKDSVYTDKDHGECYQMVLKSYCGDKKSAFELEKEAFSGLQFNEQVPIVKYLGSYTHDYGEGKDMGKTYNLLLEYGERDLYESWADETNVPPVRAQEVLRFWKSLFEVADAIRHVHHLEVPRGKSAPLRFHGWHADIKPDNILSIRGRLKLADFGFSRFAPVVANRDGSVPTELIRGFTDSYGAPEVSRMEQPDGTVSGVPQSIDTWSFGCVLSVAATWVVLGFQGVRQYEKLRELASTNNKSKVRHDRFHDGFQVLPDIRKWHDYLRGHLRPSDTTTSLVLDLIEHKLLLTDPSSRPDLDELCETLLETSKLAACKIEGLSKLSRNTDPVVLNALLKVEEEAQSQQSSKPKTTPLQQQSVVTDVGHVNPRRRASLQIQKDLIIKSKPLGQTAYRKEILEKELRSNGIIEDNEQPVKSTHNGVVTDSPIETTLPKDLAFHERPPKPKTPQAQGIAHLVPEPMTGTVANRAPILKQQPSDTHLHPRRNERCLNDPHQQPDIGTFNTNIRQARFSDDLNNEALPRDTSTLTLTTYNGNMQDLSDRSPQLHTAHARTSFESSRETGYTVCPQNSQSMPLKSSLKTPRDTHFDEIRTFSPEVNAPDQAELVQYQDPVITISPPSALLQSDQDLHTPQHQYSEKQTTEKKAVIDKPTHSSLGSIFVLPQPLPSSVFELPFDICRKRKELDQEVTRGLGKLTGRLGFETRKQDASLADTFREPRELIFVIENGYTMSEHWPIVTFVAETLAKNAAGLDKSSFDVKLTIDGHRHDRTRLKGDSGRSALKKTLKAAWPEYKANDNAFTDMARIFSDICKEWKGNGRPSTTLLALTDAVWSKTDLKALNETILSIAEHDQQHAGNRHFSIQFIRFGDTNVPKELLQELDDNLCVANNLRDIIDHCSWRTTVDKMFKGSIEGFHDQNDEDEPPIAYDYKGLVGLFQAFNEGNGTLLLSNDLQRTPSRSSSRSSASSSRWRDSAPTARLESYPGAHRHSRAPFSA